MDEVVLERAALDALDDAVIIRDGGTGRDWYNTSAARYRSARHEDALVRGALERALERASGGERFDETFDIVGPPSRIFVIRAAPLVAESEVRGAVVTLRDITEARALEAVRQDFVANVSHELKTPIGAVSLLMEVLSAESDPAVASDLIARAQLETQRLAAIVDDLLDLSAIELQGMAGSRAGEPVDLLDITTEALERFGSPAERVRVEHDGPSRIIGQRKQLVSAVANLIDNALKYSDRNQHVTVEILSSNNAVSLSVKDHGIGIPAVDQQRIFERFYRVDRARSRDTGGTGLGLSIVRNIVSAHGGTIELESIEGSGTSITLQFPSIEQP